MHRVVSFSEIGEVLISKKNNAKNMSLRVHPQKGVLITIPRFLNYKSAEDFIIKNIDWIKKRQSLIKEERENTFFSKDSIFQTRKIHINFCETDIDGDKLVAEHKNYNIKFIYNPQFIKLSEPNFQDFVQKVILKVLKIEASEYLPNRIAEISKQTGLKFGRVKIGTGKSRIGCCSTYDNIILSARLMLLPDHLIDYVILHELCHTIHKNHQAGFHNLLNSFCGGKSLALDKELKTYRFDIFPGVYPKSR